MKFCQFWGREFMPLSQKYGEGVRRFSSFARYFKAEFYRYIYIFIFAKHLSELHWIVLINFQILNVLLEFSISNFNLSPTPQYIVVRALMHVFFVALFLVAIIIIERKCIVSQQDVQHKILNRSTVLPLLVSTYKQVRKQGAET